MSEKNQKDDKKLKEANNGLATQSLPVPPKEPEKEDRTT